MAESFRNLFAPRLCGLCQDRVATSARDRDGLPCCFGCMGRAADGAAAAEPRPTDEEEARRLEAIGRRAFAAAEALMTASRGRVV